MDEIKDRLQNATESCLAQYALWQKNDRDGASREGLMDALHELRKVCARLEIEIAISERSQTASRPIPIPPHRSSRRRHQDGDYYPDDAGDEQPAFLGNGGQGNGGQGNAGGGDQKARRRRAPHGGRPQGSRPQGE